MRAWLLLLAVLATFQPIVQVASTEDITSSFIQAISPSIIEEELQQQQQQQQQDLFELAKQRDTRTIYNNNNNNKNNNNSAQQLVAASRQLTAISPIIDITALSVTKRTQSATTTTKAKTAIATIFSYNRRSDSDNYTNNGNHLNQFSAKDIKANGSGATNSDATTAIVVAVQEKKKQKINKQITKTNQKHNEVNDKHNSSIEITRSKNNNNAVQVQQLANTSDKTKSAPTTTAKSSKKLKATTSAVLSEQVEAEAKEEEAEKSEMAIQEHRLATAQEHSKRHRNHKKQQQQHRQQQHMQQQQQDMQQQHSAAHHTASAASAHLATAERLAASEATTTTHLEAAEKLAQDASLAANTPATRTSASSDASTASVSDDLVANEDDEGDSESDVTEPATYSNKEIIGEKLKPDPSTLVQIENSLLSLFNMKRPPKIDRSKIIIPEAMKQLYAQIMGHELDMETIRRPSMLSRSANTVRSFTHIESKIDDRFPHHHRFRLYFNVKSIPTEEKLRAADLQLSREAISDAVLSERLANRTSYQVLVYDITRVGVRGKREPSYKLLDNKLVHLNSTDTVSLDVQRAVDRWLATPKKNYGLLIEVRTLRTLKPAPHQHVRLRRSVDEPHDSWQHKQPVLYAYTDDGKHRMRSARDATTSSSRSKRAGHHRRAHRRKNSDEICRRHSLYVDFADVGWSDWIVAPPGYDAFYCQGKCPFPLAEHLNSTNHAVVQTLVNNLNPGKVPKACCVPTQLEGISMLYLNDQNTVVLKNYQDMTVVGCGCR